MDLYIFNRYKNQKSFAESHDKKTTENILKYT